MKILHKSWPMSFILVLGKMLEAMNGVMIVNDFEYSKSITASDTIEFFLSYIWKYFQMFCT